MALYSHIGFSKKYFPQQLGPKSLYIPIHTVIIQITSSVSGL